MELDELKDRWADRDRKLDLSIRLNRQLLRSLNTQRLRSPVQRFAWLIGLGAVSGVFAAGWMGQFIYANWGEPRFVLPAVVLDLWVIASMAASVRLVVGALQIDYSQPVAAIQRQIESLRVLRMRVTRWALLTGQLVWWIPALIVVLKGVWGVDAYQVLSPTFFVVNLAVGFALIPVAIWAAKKIGPGYNLEAATGFLADLSAFETETMM
jgi:hypothetical protein